MLIQALEQLGGWWPNKDLDSSQAENLPLQNTQVVELKVRQLIRHQVCSLLEGGRHMDGLIVLVPFIDVTQEGRHGSKPPHRVLHVAKMFLHAVQFASLL